MHRYTKKHPHWTQTPEGKERMKIIRSKAHKKQIDINQLLDIISKYLEEQDDINALGLRLLIAKYRS